MSDRSDMDHDLWLTRLGCDSLDRSAAIEELRGFLLRGLTTSLKHRYGGKVQVEDVVQVTLLKILGSLKSFQGKSKFTTWAMSIATRIGISELRRRQYRDVSFELSIGGDGFQFDTEDTYLESVGKEEERQGLFSLLQKLICESLSDRQQLAIRGALEGLSVEEIAIRLESNRNAVYKLVHDARLKLRQEFEARGITAIDISTIIS